MDTSSAKQDEVDIGRDGADGVGGTEPRPRGFPTLPEAARQPDETEAADHKAKIEKGLPGKAALEVIAVSRR